MGVLLVGLLLVWGCDDGGGTPTGLPSDSIASFRVTFTSTWSAATHPTSFPPNPHFSGLIGATHDTQATMWADGQLASPGIKNMAELGSKSPLSAEVMTLIGDGTAWSTLSGGGIGSSPGSVVLDFEVHARFPLVSLVSMIAPSPDWFVGVRDLSLLVNGAWVDSLEVELHAYDAGTDSGASYTAADVATMPPVAIARITTSPFDGNVALGTFTFVRR